MVPAFAERRSGSAYRTRSAENVRNFCLAACMAESVALPSWHSDDRCALFVSCVGERKEKHDERKKSLGSKVLVIDPIPLLTIRHGGKRIVGFLRRAENPHKRRHRGTVCELRRKGGKRALLLHVGCRHINVRAEIAKDFEHGPAQYGNLFVIGGHRSVDHTNFGNLRIEIEEFAYLDGIRLYRWVWVLAEYESGRRLVASFFHPLANFSGLLNVTQFLDERIKLRVGIARSRSHAEPATYAIDAMHGKP